MAKPASKQPNTTLGDSPSQSHEQNSHYARSKKKKRRRSASLYFLLLSTSSSGVEGFVCRRSHCVADASKSELKHHDQLKFTTSLNNSNDGDAGRDPNPKVNGMDGLFSSEKGSKGIAENNPVARGNNFEPEISGKLSVTRDRAISALSRPGNLSNNDEEETIRDVQETPPGQLPARRKNNQQIKATKSGKRKEGLLPKPEAAYEKSKGFQKRKKQKRMSQRRNISKSSGGELFDSVLPPPIQDTSNRENSLSDGLSSWEDFLGKGPGGSKQKKRNVSPRSGFERSANSQKSSKREHLKDDQGRQPAEAFGAEQKDSHSLSSYETKESLPSIADLFPPEIIRTLGEKSGKQTRDENNGNSSSLSPPPPALNGVLPVSDLFYRSAQSMRDDDDESIDDEELPFSAEQSDQLTSTNNKVKFRRNQAKTHPPPPPPTPKSKWRPRRSTVPRKMVRRGMEMLVGGVPINADPPQRYVDLIFQHGEATEWSEAISVNTRDFGPMLHSASAALLSDIEKGLFCEHFVQATMKWDVCPEHLKTIVKSYTDSLRADGVAGEYDQNGAREVTTMAESTKTGGAPAIQLEDLNPRSRPDSSESSPSIGFAKVTSLNTLPANATADDDTSLQSHLGGELVFNIGVSREELETGDDSGKEPVLERVLARGILASTECTGFRVTFTKLTLTDLDDGATMIDGEFMLTLKENGGMNYAEMEKKAQRINSALAQAMDDGDMQLAMAAAARKETQWPESVRERVVEEFLFDDDDGDGPLEEGGGRSEPEPTYQSNANTKQSRDEYDGPFGMPGSVVYHKDDLFLGGGNDGVFWNYAADNTQGAPYKGNLGLRLVDAVVQRAKERHPRVIAIGDVHGCIDELQDLLRKCDYSPGDLVVFLGDLVSKGPDSISVVKMAREIGALGVRGNHDFEVIRWHQAIKSGVDPPVADSEHFHIATCLSKADMKWMYSLPWYLSSKELGTLMVHAGFVSGIRLAKQNPRLMMNMRSILPDGTVTSKFFNNWPWARLWDGPQTVLFGHDADRGLQQYEHAIGLDTGCVYGGRLTACILPEKRLVSVNARREYFKYRRKHYD